MVYIFIFHCVTVQAENCVMTRMRDGEFDVNAIPLGLLGLPWSDLTEKAWNQT